MPLKTIVTIKDIQNIAALNGGKCLSKRYKNSTTKMRFECAAGHRWNATRTFLNAGKWCAVCSGRRRGNKSTSTLEMFQEIAAGHNGKLLSAKLINSLTKLEFECAEGHRWKALPGSILNGSWCRKCFFTRIGKEKKGSIDIFKKIAQKHGGKCLATEYGGVGQTLEFECAKGHRWMGWPGSIKNGSWCMKCFRERIKGKRKGK
jgi:hypothetical protein